MSRPSILPFQPHEVGPRDWGTELLIAQTPHYIMKRLFMKAGAAGGLQYHRRKIETFYLESGDALVDFDNNGYLSTYAMLPGESIHVPAGAPHRVTALTDCVFFEASTPVFDDRVRCEAEYGQPEVGGLPTTHAPSADGTGQP